MSLDDRIVNGASYKEWVNRYDLMLHMFRKLKWQFTPRAIVCVKIHEKLPVSENIFINRWLNELVCIR